VGYRISIHAPTRGATQTHNSRLTITRYFNPRSHTGSDFGAVFRVGADDGFQSTLPHGERRDCLLNRRLHNDFNPRSHTGSDKQQQRQEPQRQAFQSTLPHGERRGGARPAAAQRSFQSTLPHGERPQKMGDLSKAIDFNPRSHTGSDGNLSAGTAVLNAISIHAPTRGATRKFPELSWSRAFQSTLPHGERQYYSKCKTAVWDFNPRSHTGSDIFLWSNKSTIIRFQSTLPHGERLYLYPKYKLYYRFQSTLPHGERHKKRAVGKIAKNFNPRSHTGSDGIK